MRTTCTNHCKECGNHFSSLMAFDAHRAGDHELGRYCEEPADLVDRQGNPRLTPLSDAGVCRLARSPQTGVTVWTDAKGLERARTTFGRAA